MSKKRNKDAPDDSNAHEGGSSDPPENSVDIAALEAELTATRALRYRLEIEAENKRIAQLRGRVDGVVAQGNSPRLVASLARGTVSKEGLATGIRSILLTRIANKEDLVSELKVPDERLRATLAELEEAGQVYRFSDGKYVWRMRDTEDPAEVQRYAVHLARQHWISRGDFMAIMGADKEDKEKNPSRYFKMQNNWEYIYRRVDPARLGKLAGETKPLYAHKTEHAGFIQVMVMETPPTSDMGGPVKRVRHK